MNFVFLMVFYMLFLGKTIVWTAQACTKHTLGKNRLLRSRKRFWSDFGLFWPPFGTPNAPNSPKKRDWKFITFLLDFLLIFGSILDPILAPKIRNAQKNLQKIRNDRFLAPERAPGTILERFWLIFLDFCRFFNSSRQCFLLVLRSEILAKFFAKSANSE